MSKLGQALSKLWNGGVYIESSKARAARIRLEDEWNESGPYGDAEIDAPKAKAKAIQFYSIANLADALVRAKDAHAEYERGLGQADTNWPLWYAGYLAMEQSVCTGQTCGVRNIKPQTKSPSVEKVESSTLDLSSEDGEYWSSH